MFDVVPDASEGTDAGFPPPYLHAGVLKPHLELLFAGWKAGWMDENAGKVGAAGWVLEELLQDHPPQDDMNFR